MPNLAEYSLADINKFNLLGDFPQDFKTACSSADLELSLVFSEANSNGKAISIEDFNLSERLLTATYKFQLTALMANRTISANAPGNFGLYGYLEEIASHFDKGENLDELGNVALFVKCIQNSVEFLAENLSAFAKKTELDEEVAYYVSTKISEAKKYYDHADKIFAEFVEKWTEKDVKKEKVSAAEQSLKKLASLSLYETSRLVCNKDYDYVDSILSHAPFDPATDDKDAVYTFEKFVILSNINYSQLLVFNLYKCLKDNNAFDSNGNVIRYVGMTGYKYDELKNASLRTFKDPSQIKDYIIETDDLIAAVCYILSALKYTSDHYVFLANYRGMEEKLGNPPDSYIQMLIKYYSKLYADFVNVYNRLLVQYLSDMKPDANGVYYKYKSIVSLEAATAKSKCFESENARKAAEKPKTATVTKPKTTTVTSPVKPSRKPEDEKKMRDLSASAAYKMADDASVTDKQRNDYIDNLVAYAADTSNADTSIDLSEKALLIGRKSHYKCDLSIKNLINRLKYKNCITNDNRPSGTLAGTLGNAYASCVTSRGKTPYIGSSARYTTSALSIALCLIFIGFIWLVNHESVQWLGTANMKKLLILAGLGIICGIFTGGAKKIISNLVTTGVVFTVGAIVTDVLDFSQIAQDRTILTISALIFGFNAFVSMAENTRGSIEGAKRKNAENTAKLKNNIAGNIQYANAMIETLEPMRAKNADAAVLIEYYKTVKKAFESIKI